MAKAKFNRDGNGGYLATHTCGNRTYTATLVKTEHGRWTVGSGFAGGIGPFAKLRDLKDAWVREVESGEPSSPQTTPSEPPKLSSPPPIGGPPPIPKLKPKPKPEANIASPVDDDGVEIIPPLTRAAEAGFEPHMPVTDAAFEKYLAEQGRLCSGSLINRPDHEFRCGACGMHNAGLWSKHDGVLFPPCRCQRFEGLPSEYVPDSLDPRMWGRTRSGAKRTPSPVGALDMVYNWMRANPDQCSAGGRLVEPFASVQRVLWDLTGYAEYRPELWG